MRTRRPARLGRDGVHRGIRHAAQVENKVRLAGDFAGPMHRGVGVKLSRGEYQVRARALPAAARPSPYGARVPRSRRPRHVDRDGSRRPNGHTRRGSARCGSACTRGYPSPRRRAVPWRPASDPARCAAPGRRGSARAREAAVSANRLGIEAALGQGRFEAAPIVRSFDREEAGSSNPKAPALPI